MKKVLYPLTYLGLCPFVIVLARALQSQKAFQPTYLAVTPAEAAYGLANLPPEQLEISLAKNPPNTHDVFGTDEQYEQVYGFMQAKCGGSHAVWRERVNSLYQLVERVVLQRQINLMVLWNGNDCIGKICQMLANKHGINTLFLENGYFPNTLQIDSQGVNAEASIASVPADRWNVDLPTTPAQPLHLEPIRPTTLRQLGFLDRIRIKLNTKLNPNFYKQYPELLDQKNRKQVQSNLELSSSEALLSKRKPFALVVLQVHDDTQILLNSPLFKHPEEFVQHCHDNIRRVLGDDYDIVIKLHPLDIGRICYAHMQAALKNVSWVGAEPIQPLLDNSSFVMVINSSVGLQSIAIQKPTVVFGDSFYSRNEICRVIRSPNETENHLRSIQRGTNTVDPTTVQRFLTYLNNEYFVRGRWNLSPQDDLRPTIQRILGILEARTQTPASRN